VVIDLVYARHISSDGFRQIPNLIRRNFAAKSDDVAVGIDVNLARWNSLRECERAGTYS